MFFSVDVCSRLLYQRHHMDSTPLLDPVPVRFTPESKQRLVRIAKSMGLKPCELVRRAVDKNLTEWESTGVLIIRGGQVLGAVK
jgi:hypothetical protein